MKRIKDTIISIILVTALLCSIFAIVPFQVSATDTGWEVTENVRITEGDFTYVVLDDGTAEIIDYNIGSEVRNLEIPSEIGGYTVTSIGNSAFRDAKNLLIVKIPETVKTIGYCAFEDCENLVRITPPTTILSIDRDAFKGTKWYESQPDETIIIGSCLYECRDDSTGEFVIPDTVKSIAVAAFREKNFSKITIPNTVEIIGNDAFFCCDNITNMDIPDSVTTIGDYAFYNCNNLTGVTIPKSVTYMGDYVFAYCDRLADIDIKANIKVIGEYAFEHCGGIKEVTIPESVKTIGDFAFSECSALTKVNLPDQLDDIGTCAFSGCNKLITISIPKNLKKVNLSCVSSTSLLKIEVSEDNAYLSSVDGVLYNKDKTTLIMYPKGKCDTSFTVPETVIKLGDYSFSDCVKLTEIILPESITSIGKCVFSNCLKLTEITLPESINSIGEYAFKNCKKLTEITLPESITSMGEFVFENCEKLNSIALPKSITSLSAGLFDGCSSLESVSYSDSITEIGGAAFYECKSLKKIHVPDTVKSFGRYAFYGCQSLDVIDIPPDVTNIYENTFDDCQKLAGYRVDENNRAYSSISGMLCNKDGSVLISCPQNKLDATLTIPESVKTIEENAFIYNRNLSVVTIPSTVTEIKDNAFANCSRLNSVKILAPIEKLGNGIFQNCTYLTNVTINSNIGYNMFRDCKRLKNVSVGEKCEYIRDAFGGVKELYIEVPNTHIFFDNLSNRSSITLVGADEGYLSKLAKTGGYKFKNNGTVDKKIFGYEVNGTINTANGQFKTIRVTGYYGNDKNIVIPAIIDGYIVTEIGYAKAINQYVRDEYAELYSISRGCGYFDYGEELSSVSIPSTVTYIISDALGYTLTDKSVFTDETIGRVVYKYPEKRSNFRIICVKGTAGENYAKENGFKYTSVADTFVLPPNRTKVVLPKTRANLYVKGSTAIKATVKNPIGKTVYKSSNPKTAKVDSKGNVTALKAGKVKISVTNNMASKVFNITVLNPKLNKNTATLIKNKSFTLKITGKIGTARFSSSNTKVATVNSKGKIVAKKKGTAVITVNTNGVKLKCKVNVK